jgi:hypothetical protein
MSISDESFREAFKPLHIPAHYQDANNDQDKVVYALAQLGQGSADDVTAKLAQLDNSLIIETFTPVAASILNNLFDKGLIKGALIAGKTHYDLSKITEANDGAVNPDMLATGLD